MSPTDITLGALFLAGYFAFIYWSRKSKSFSHFAVADRDVGPWLLFATLSATFIGPGFSLSFVASGAQAGFFLLPFALFWALQLWITGLWLAPRIKRRYPAALSIGDIIAGPGSHDHWIVRLLVGLTSFGLCAGFASLMAKSGGEIFSYCFGWDPIWGMLLLTGLVMLYSTFGGVRATMLTDAFQFMLFVVMLPLLVLVVWLSDGTSAEQLGDRAMQLTSAGVHGHSGLEMVGLIAAFFLGEMMSPPLVSRINAATSGSAARKAFAWSGVFYSLWLPMMLLLGVLGSVVKLAVGEPEQLLISLGHAYFPPGLYGIFLVAVLGIVMSSQDSLMNSAAVIVVRDIIEPFAGQSERAKLLITHAATVAVAVLAVIIGAGLESILQGFLLFYSIWAPAILVVLMASLYVKQIRPLAGLGGILGGMGAVALFNLAGMERVIPPIIGGTLVSLASYITLHYTLSRSSHHEDLSDL